jgi:beta-1,4-mannosyl-glycoprotein beta-1,4-N-acetylglucosaminyltransferase
MPKVSICIPTYNHCSDLLAPCIESILQYTDLTDVEIIVVANGCTDNTREYLVDKPVNVIWSDKPLGYTKAINIGIKESTGEFIVVLNNDTVLLSQIRHQWITLLLEPFSNPQVGVTGPMLTTCPQTNRDFLIFFCACIRRTVFNQYGPFDEIFSPGWGEDTDFCHKIEDAGYHIVQVCPSGRYYADKRMVGAFPIFHKGGETLVDLPNSSEVINRNSQKLVDRYLDKIERATYCDGYMSDIELRWLAREAKKHRVIIEVGSWCGRSTRALGDNTSGVIYAVDHFNGSKSEEPLHDAAKLKDGDYAFIDFCNNTMDLIQKGRIIPFRGTSANMAKLMKQHGIKADMIFIDGGHQYEEVKQDIADWKDLLTDDGLFCGHDFTAWAGVNQAVRESLYQFYVGQDTTIWFCEKKDIKFDDQPAPIVRSVTKGAIYDCFIFNDELDMLEKRFMALFDAVDRFVIVEGTRTFANQPKLLHFRDNLDRFKPYLSKISHVVVDDFPDPTPFGMENHQRDCIMRALGVCRDTDIVMISDCDEIPSVRAIREYNVSQGIQSFEMDMYYYNMHTLSVEKWRHPKIMPYALLKQIKPGGARYAEQFKLNPGIISNGGVHLSFFGDTRRVIKKLEEYSHQEYNTGHYKDPARVQAAIEQGVDLFGRDGIQFIKSDRLTLDEAGIKYGTQKCSLHHDFCVHYERALAGRNIRTVLEIGIDRGASLRMWEEFYPTAAVWGFDIESSRLVNEGRIRSCLCNQADPTQLRAAIGTHNLHPDLVVDDGSHVWSHQIATYEALSPYMLPGGIYVVEDLHTSFILEYKDQEQAQRPLDYFSALPHFTIVKTNGGASITGIGIIP